MFRIAMIKDGVVENISVWSMQTPWSPGVGYVLYNITEHAEISIGDTYNYVTKEFTKKDENGNTILVLEIPTKLITLVDGLPA